MSGDDEIQALIASIEAQLAAVQQRDAQWPQSLSSQQAGHGMLQPLQGFPAKGESTMAGGTEPMSDDDDIAAQIASIEAQLAAAEQQRRAQGATFSEQNGDVPAPKKRKI